MSGVGLEVREGCLAKLGWEQRPGWPLLGTTCHLLGRLKPRLHLRGLCRTWPAGRGRNGLSPAYISVTSAPTRAL